MKTVMTVMALMILFVSAAAVAGGNIEAPASCQLCRMDRTMFAHTRMLVIYADGVKVGVCSIHCAVEEMMSKKRKQVNKLLVADFKTKELKEADAVTWIVGGKKKGVMTALPKWAFARKEDAREFQNENGGKIMPLSQVIKLASEEVRDMEAVVKLPE